MAPTFDDQGGGIRVWNNSQSLMRYEWGVGINLGAPYDPQFIVEINTPIQFNWTPRGIAGDSYRLIIEDSQNPTPSFDSGALGNVGLYRLASRPPGFTTGPTYYVWYIAVDTPAGTGFSFNSGAVEFKN